MTKNFKICSVCGKSFPCPPSQKTVTCSKPCSKIHKSRTHKGKSNSWNAESRNRKSAEGKTQNLLSGTAAALLSPRSGHFETNRNAKPWHLISPSGKHYSFRNLNLWAEKNYKMFGFDHPDNAYKIACGIRVAKRGAEGKIKACTYKGWRVILDHDVI